MKISSRSFLLGFISASVLCAISYLATKRSRHVPLSFAEEIRNFSVEDTKRLSEIIRRNQNDFFYTKAVACAARAEFASVIFQNRESSVEMQRHCSIAFAQFLPISDTWAGHFELMHLGPTFEEQGQKLRILIQQNPEIEKVMRQYLPVGYVLTKKTANQALVPTVTSVTPAADAPVAPAAPAAHL
jgi:hypothetical protein